MSTVPEPERLGPAFFARDAVTVARELVGAELHRGPVGGTIVETEAYTEDDPACHAFGGPTPRSEVLFGPPGRAYVYLSYGIHQLFNVVTGPDGEAGAVLIRAIVPERGLAEIRRRRAGRPDRELCSGPGRLTLALGITAADNRRDLATGRLRLTPGPGGGAPSLPVVAGPRIGITKAAERPWRFCSAAPDHRRWLSAVAG